MGIVESLSILNAIQTCNSNIRSTTIYESFLGAVALPSRVRVVKIRLWHSMIEHRGAERNSMIVGSSVHNQRIERLWRDTLLQDE